jgi:hypothetical protein
MVYVTQTARVLEDDNAIAALVDWVERNDFDAVALYGLEEALAQPDRLAQLLAELHSHGVDEIEAVVPRSLRVLPVLAFQEDRPPGSSFTTVNFEHEYWNPNTRLGDKAWDTQQMDELRKLAAANGLAFGRYIGGKTITLADARRIVKRTDYLLVHCYVPSAAFPEVAYTYTRQRLQMLDKAAASIRRRYPVRIIFSAEPRYMQSYFSRHTFRAAYDAFLRKAPEFEHLVLDGYAIYNTAFAMEARP